MIAPLLRSMLCPPNFSVLRREGSRRDFDAFGRSRRSCEGTTAAGGALRSGENGGSRCERGPPLVIPPNGLRREPLRMYFYTRADNQASALELLSKITSCRPVLATFSIHTAPSRRPSVVVMQAIEDWECHDTTVSLGHSRQRLFLPEALVWPRLVVEAGVLRDEAQKMALAKHEDMVEQFPPESADKALGEDVHVRRPDRGANDLGADSFEQAREPSTELGVAIDDKHFGLDVQGCVSRLLRTPVIGRRPGDCSMHDSPSLQIEKQKDEDRAEEHVEGLHKVTSPGNVVVRGKVLQRWPSPGTRFFMYRCTVRFETRIPSLSSSPRSRSAPRLGFRAAISRISVA